nr:MAG TPA: hypothetical protein [Caudoviricetes sp.]
MLIRAVGGVSVPPSLLPHGCVGTLNLYFTTSNCSNYNISSRLSKTVFFFKAFFPIFHVFIPF